MAGSSSLGGIKLTPPTEMLVGLTVLSNSTHYIKNEFKNMYILFRYRGKINI